MDPPSWVPFADTGRLAEPLWIYTILIVIAAVLFVLARNFVRSRPGRALIAVRDNPASASASGINPALYKGMAFAASAVYGGLAGSMLMLNRPFASDAQFGTRVAIFLVVGLVVGGTGSHLRRRARARSSTSSCRTSCRSGRTTSRACRPVCARSRRPLFELVAPGRADDLRAPVRRRPARAHVPAPGRLRRRRPPCPGTHRPRRAASSHYGAVMLTTGSRFVVTHAGSLPRPAAARRVARPPQPRRGRRR